MKAPDFFILKPGVTVKVTVSGVQDAAQQATVLASLTKKLQDNGCKVLPVGSIELVASTEMGRLRTIEYRGIGPGGGGSRNVSVQEYLSHLKLVYQGQTVWQTNTSNVETSVMLNEGETLEQHIRANDRPNYALFSVVNIPKTLQKPGPGGDDFNRLSRDGAGHPVILYSSALGL